MARGCFATPAHRRSGAATGAGRLSQASRLVASDFVKDFRGPFVDQPPREPGAEGDGLAGEGVIPAADKPPPVDGGDDRVEDENLRRGRRERTDWRLAAAPQSRHQRTFGVDLGEGNLVAGRRDERADSRIGGSNFQAYCPLAGSRHGISTGRHAVTRFPKPNRSNPAAARTSAS